MGLIILTLLGLKYFARVGQISVAFPSDTDRLELADALHLLNHHLAPDRETYIQRIKSNALAKVVKMHDLTHNMDLTRIPNPAKKDYERIERYKKEYDYLSGL